MTGRIGGVRSIAALLALAALIPATLALAADGDDDTSASADPQSVFRAALLSDEKVSSTVKRLLRTNAGFIDPNPQFADLTGDTKSDAIVTVATPGSAGVIAVYVFSTDGAKRLRAVFRNQGLYRAVTKPDGASLQIRVPVYAKGDDFCCPSKITQRTYGWDAKAKAFKRAASTTFDGPGASTAP